MAINLYFDSLARSLYIKDHLFLKEHIENKIISPLDNIFQDIETYQLSLINSFAEAGYNDETTYESIHDQTIDYSIRLGDFQREMYLSALSHMFHNFEKQLRRFLDRELKGYVYIKKGKDFMASEAVWRESITDIFDFFASGGYCLKSTGYFSKIDACRLIVNVFKHGKGNSLLEIQTKYNKYLLNYVSSNKETIITNSDYNDISINKIDFIEFADAIINFWQELPERLTIENKP